VPHPLFGRVKSPRDAAASCTGGPQRGLQIPSRYTFTHGDICIILCVQNKNTNMTMRYLKALTNHQTFESLRNTTLVVTGWLCTLGGLVADVLQPIAPFAFYVFVCAAIALVLLCILYFRGKRDLLGAVAFAGLATIIFGLLSLLQSGDEAQERGIVAAAVPAVASLQQSLGIIDEKLDAIKEDTVALRQSSERLEANSASIMRSLEEIREGFNRDGIIAQPESPEEHYHNARLHELEGDYSAARRSYLEYFSSELPLLDPHLRFIAFLKVQEGTAGARETYNTVTARSEGDMPAYARLLLLGRDARINALQSYFQEHPEFAPVAYHLSLEYSERRLGSQTLSDKRQELAYLNAFEERDAKGGLLRYLIDQELAGQWREDVSTRKIALQAHDGAILENPVSLSWMPNNAGWNANITIAEPVTDIRWNIKGKTQAISTGMSGYTDPATGKPAPRTFFSLPAKQKDATIQIRYTDLSGAEQGPFEFAFAGKKESVDANRRLLEATSSSWLSFQEYDRKPLLYFSMLMTYRGALSKIEYGLNTATPNKVFRFPAWKKGGLAPIDAKTPTFIKVPSNTRYATVRLTYKGGDKSPIMRFDR